MSIAILSAAEAAQAAGDDLADHLDEIAAGLDADVLGHAEPVEPAGAVLGSGARSAAALAREAEALHDRRGRSGGNGSLMRTAPVALALIGDRVETARLARSISELTHHDPFAGDACVLWCAAIQHAVEFGAFDIRGGLELLPEERREFWAAHIYEAEQRPASAFERNNWVVQALQAAWSLIARTPVPQDDPGADSHPAQHLRLVLEGAARLAHDTDTVGAIAGALVGARWGASAVPANWRRIVHGWPGLTGSDLARRGLALARGGCDDLGWPLGERVVYTSSAARGQLVQHPHDPGLWLGDMITAENPPEGMDAIVSLCRIGTRQFPDADPASVIDVWLVDTESSTSNPNLGFVVADTADLIADLRAEGKTVLLHCVAAQSRTPTIAAAYSIRHLGIPPTTALDHVCQALPAAIPNPRFRAHVQDLAAAPRRE